jgi:hypothetical protein
MRAKRNSQLAVLTITSVSLAVLCSAQTPGERLQQVVQPYVNAQMFMGSVLVAQKGKVLFSKG